MEINVLLGLALALVVLFYVARAFAGHLLGLGKMLLRVVAAFAGIWAFNVVAGIFGIHLGLNVVSALTAALLGLPGVALLFAVKYLL